MADKNSNQELKNEPNPDNESLNEEAAKTRDKSSTGSGSKSQRRRTNVRKGGPGVQNVNKNDNSREANVKRFMQVINSERLQKLQEERDERYTPYEVIYDFPKDTENWREEDLKELWADAPLKSTKPGWDPNWADEDDEDAVCFMIEEEDKEPILAPFYVPYRKYYPVIPNNNQDIKNAKHVIEELDRIEEFLTWVSYIFHDGSSYEGTVWDDLAHGKGVYVAEQGLVRYEGEWLQNNMEGHGVVEVDIPNIEPVPGSKLEAKMRAEGKIIQRDFMSPEDKEWLEMDIEDSMKLAAGRREIPFYEKDDWISLFGNKPEKGRYRYAGQWKHARMHGCGVYEVNERVLYGRFYFGELLEDTYGCDADISAMHAAIADVAAAKARMFVNKPDGMVREQWGPYSDPQHPYLYEEDDVWMAPGFINQFYEVPDYWKTYMHEVDEEREMWVNSFYKAPLRLPMPAELEYWWANDEEPEFVLINKEPEPDPEDPSKLIYTEDPLILHTPTGRIIDYVDDEEHGIRLFWLPPLKEEEDLDLDKVEFLPLGFDEFYGREVRVDKESFLKRLITSIENKLKPLFEKLEKWTEEKTQESEMKIDLLRAEIELREAELTLKEAIEDTDEELKRMQKEEEKKVALGLQEEENTLLPKQVEEQVEEVDKTKARDDEDEEEDEAVDEEDITASSFGSVEEQDLTRNDVKGKGTGKSPFAASSLSFTASSIVSMVPSLLRQSFSEWKKSKLKIDIPHSPLSTSCFNNLPLGGQQTSSSVAFSHTRCKSLSSISMGVRHRQVVAPITKLRPRNCPKQKAYTKVREHFEEQSFNILSLHSPIQIQ